MAFNWISFASVISTVLLVLLGISIATVNLMKKGESSEDSDLEYFSKDSLENVCKNIGLFVIWVETKLHRVYRLENPISTIKLLASVYLISVLTENICSCLLIWVSINLLFLSVLVFSKYHE